MKDRQENAYNLIVDFYIKHGYIDEEKILNEINEKYMPYTDGQAVLTIFKDEYNLK